MKHLSLIIISSLSAALFFTTEMSTLCKTSRQEIIPVIISPKPSNPGGNPRSPETTLFSAYRTNDEIILSCAIDSGIVEIELYSTAGDSFLSEFDTAEETILIPISGDVGDYTLTITDTREQVYVGGFSII